MSPRTKLKRVFDIIVAAWLLVLLSPVFVLLSVLVWVFLGRPVLFKQVRPGLHAQPFEMLKFRTMTSACDQEGNLLADEDRLTRFGAFLRSSSLDELPELVNVLKGEMSLVGPRPLLMEYLPLYDSRQMLRHDVKPGITGWAQINGRNSLDWEQKFELDVWYVQNQSLALDIRILFKTVSKVFSRHGVSAEGHVTAEKFKGNK